MGLRRSTGGGKQGVRWCLHSPLGWGLRGEESQQLVSCYKARDQLGTELGKRRDNEDIKLAYLFLLLAYLHLCQVWLVFPGNACWTSGLRQRSKWGGWLEEKMIVEMEEQAIAHGLLQSLGCGRGLD